MEAWTKYDYEAQAADEISFYKGAVIKILKMSGNWYRAEHNTAEGYVPKNYIDINIPSWYKENIRRHDAVTTLMPQPVGAFLVRNKPNAAPGDFAVSVRRHTGVLHLKVLRDSMGQYYLWSEKFPSLNKLVEYYKVNSISKQSEIFLQETSKQCDGGSLENPGVAVSPATSARSGRSPVPVLQQAERRRARRVRALYDFKAAEPDELEFSAGDVIQVLEVHCDYWWRGRLRGKTGLFPSSYTEPN